MAAGTIPAAMIRVTASLASAIDGKSAQSVNRRRVANQSDNHFGDDAEGAFRSDDGRQKIETGLLPVDSAQANRRTVGKDRFHLEDMVDGEAVLETVSATGVLRDIPRSCTPADWTDLAQNVDRTGRLPW